MWQVWLVIAGMFFIIEMATVGFFVFWFGIGSLFAMVTSLFAPENMILQCVVFFVSSVILLILTKPLVDKFTKKDIKVNTNAYSILGKKAIVTKKIDNSNGLGLVKVGNEVWSAKSSTDAILEEGQTVKVIKIDGVKAIVELTDKTISLLNTK